MKSYVGKKEERAVLFSLNDLLQSYGDKGNSVLKENFTFLPLQKEVQ